MQQAIHLIDRRIAAHRGAIETLESLRTEMAAEARPEQPAPAPALAVTPAPPAAPWRVSPAERPPAPAPVVVAGLGPLPAPTTIRRPGRPGRPPNPANVRRDPPPPPGLSMRDRILEQITVRPMTSGEIVKALPGVVSNSIYDALAKMRKAGIVAMWEDPSDGALKNRLMSTMVAEMQAADAAAAEAPAAMGSTN